MNRGWFYLLDSDVIEAGNSRSLTMLTALFQDYVPAHCGVEGNEGADRLAVAGAALYKTAPAGLD